MEENEFKEKVKELANQFGNAVAKMDPCTVNFGFQKMDRCKNYAIISLTTRSGLHKRYEIWEPNSGGVHWDVKDLGFGAFV